MSKAVLRIAKIKTMGAVAATGKHNSRERDTPNADASKTPDNFRLDMYPEKNTLDAVQNLLPEKVRKNAVYAVEVVMSASPEFFEKMDRRDIGIWASRCKDWVAAEFGGGQNVANFTVHLDEQTPHIHAVVVPLKEGKLNCRHYLGGTRDVLSKFQDRFAEELKKQYPDIERGEKGSVAEHQEVKTYYERLKSGPEKRPVLEKGVLGNYTKESVDALVRWADSTATPFARATVQARAEKDRAEAEAQRAKQEAMQATESLKAEQARRLVAEKKLMGWDDIEREYEKLKGKSFKETIQAVLKDPVAIAAMKEREAKSSPGRSYGD